MFCGVLFCRLTLDWVPEEDEQRRGDEAGVSPTANDIR